MSGDYNCKACRNTGVVRGDEAEPGVTLWIACSGCTRGDHHNAGIHRVTRQHTEVVTDREDDQS